MHTNANPGPDGRQRPSGMLRRWSTLLFGIVLVWLFMFVIAPWIQKSPSVKPLADFIEESGIDASALFYTEVEEASDAELYMRSTLKYGPEGTDSP
ncbi:MAG TPA: hypothetical protein DCO77_12250 [Nitrospiraceae bacterium]|nr:hypothetical protein [Nitrospiraceae bacterium]